MSLSDFGSLGSTSVYGATTSRSLRSGNYRLSDLRSLRFRTRNRRQRRTTGTPATVSSSRVQAKMVLGRASYRQSGYEYVFPFPPIDIQYSGISGQWVDIARPGRTPIVDYAGAQLLQVSFKFLVARPWDGLEYSVDRDLETLRYICSSRNTVTFYGFDGMLTKPFQQPGQATRRRGGFFFHVIDFSVNSLRRNERNEITAAECTITVQENNNPNISYVSFPSITYPSSTTTPIKTSSTTSQVIPFPGMTATQWSTLQTNPQTQSFATAASGLYSQYFPAASTTQATLGLLDAASRLAGGGGLSF